MIIITFNITISDIIVVNLRLTISFCYGKLSKPLLYVDKTKGKREMMMRRRRGEEKEEGNKKRKGKNNRISSRREKKKTKGKK